MYKLKETSIEIISKQNKDIKIFNHLSIDDNRGSLKIQFEGLTNSNHFSIKESFSKSLTARGLHFQNSPFKQSKIISISKGEIIDFYLDTRDPEKKIFYFLLTESMNVSILFNENYAHGFIALRPTIFRYICLGKYSESNEITYNVFPSISKLLNLGNLIQSKKDTLYPSLEVSLL